MFHLPAMPQKWWKQQVGSPWWRLILTLWLKLTALWLPPSALFLDPHASASNSPNSLTAWHVHTHAHTWKHKRSSPETQQGQISPLCYLLHYLPTSCPKSPTSAPSKPAVFTPLRLEGWRWRRTWKTGASGLVKWMFVVYKETTTTLFLLSPHIVRSDIVLFSMCEVESFDILLVPTLESVGKEELDTATPKKEPSVWKILRGLKDTSILSQGFFSGFVFSIWNRAGGEAPPDKWTPGPVRD